MAITLKASADPAELLQQQDHQLLQDILTMARQHRGEHELIAVIAGTLEQRFPEVTKPVTDTPADPFIELTRAQAHRNPIHFLMAIGAAIADAVPLTDLLELHERCSRAAAAELAQRGKPVSEEAERTTLAVLVAAATLMTATAEAQDAREAMQAAWPKPN